MDRRALKYYNELARYPPQECDCTHRIQCSPEPDLCRHLGSMLGEDARIEEENREFDHSDCRRVEVLEDVKDVVPLLCRVRTSHGLMLAKVEMGRCSSDQPNRIRPFSRAQIRLTYEITDRQHPSQHHRKHDGIVIVPKSRP